MASRCIWVLFLSRVFEYSLPFLDPFRGLPTQRSLCERRRQTRRRSPPRRSCELGGTRTQIAHGLITRRDAMVLEDAATLVGV